ncbi:MAG TPA: hypothetical protein VNU95_05155 [Candidatus Acidoferrales bacterium]|jgi:hypothetical protein|nr:hypothetical protein [Candidatus Acidoferrales bacterium]
MQNKELKMKNGSGAIGDHKQPLQQSAHAAHLKPLDADMTAHPESNPPLLPPFPSVQNSYQEPQIRKPLQGCAKLCKSVQGPPRGGRAAQPATTQFKGF